MRRRAVYTTLLAIGLMVLPSHAASADDDRPTPTPKPTPTPGPGLTTAQTPAPIPTPAPRSSATAAPTSTATASPSPTGDPAISDPAEARARDAALLANARTLAQVIDAQARVAQDELVALGHEVTQVSTDLEGVNADIADLAARSAERRALQDRLARDAFRLNARSPSPAPAAISQAQSEALDDLRSLEAGLGSAQARLEDRATTLARLTESVGAKQGQLARLRDRARVLAAAAANGDTEARAAQVAVLRALAQDAAAAQTSLAQLVASAMTGDGVSTTSWSLPVRGPITQPFGPSALELEPARIYRGTFYEHFHDAIDVAASLGTPVMAAADGQVTFVGHLPDGAMIVLVAHAGGFVTEYAHLDDTFVLPPVRAGQNVKAGQVIGFVGLTGITTGPHVHFAVLRSGEPVDPLSLIGR